jgi:hypothetical protein
MAELQSSSSCEAALDGCGVGGGWAGGRTILRRGERAGWWPAAGSVVGLEEEDKRSGLEKKRNKWVPCKRHKSLFTLQFNTVSAENELKCHFRKKLKFRC